MQKVAQGDLDMLKILFERHHVHLFNFIFKMCGDRMLSEDLTQEVFYKILKYRTSYNNGKYISWMFTIARNSIATHFKKAKETQTDIDLVAHKLVEKDPMETQDYSHLHYALNRLEPSDRELVMLNRFQGIKYEELATITSSTPGAVKTKMSRALKKLRSLYFEK